MTEHPRVTLAPGVLAGKPVIRGTRLSVEFVIGLMADGWSEADILGNYPGVTHDDIIACLAYARDTLSSEKVSELLADALARRRPSRARPSFRWTSRPMKPLVDLADKKTVYATLDADRP